MDTLPSLLSRGHLELLDRLATLSPKGDLVEVGVYRGGSASVLYYVSEAQKRNLYLYDTFTGIPYKDEIDSHQVGDFSETSFEKIKESFPNAVVQQGIFPDNVFIPEKIAFVHLDCDQYKSYRDALDTLIPRMLTGGTILCDDYCLGGAIKAIDETPGIKEIIEGKMVFRF